MTFQKFTFFIFFALPLNSCTKNTSVSSNKDMQPVVNHEVKKDKEQTAPLNCKTYRYSTCPDGCEKVCVSSTCGDQEGMPCTADCDGEGSCKEK